MNTLYELRLFARKRRFASDPLRADLVRAFSAIDSHISSGHSPYELLFIADAILKLDLAGPIVECGAYKGASSAKLSLVAKATGRKLYVCDSFQGLPQGEEKHQRTDGTTRKFVTGEYASSLDEVRNNIRRWGSLDPCHFVPGYFCDSLPALHVEPAAVFMDVDYVRSARECLKYLWPRLKAGGLFFTHEAAFLSFIQGITEGCWWHEHLGCCPPPIFGAGYGVDPLAPYVAYFCKPLDKSRDQPPTGHFENRGEATIRRDPVWPAHPA